MALQLVANILMGGLVGGLAHKLFNQGKEESSHEGHSKVGSDRRSGRRSKPLRDQATGQLDSSDGDEGKPPVQGDEGDGESRDSSKNGADDEGGQDGPSDSSEDQNNEEEGEIT